MRRRSNGPGDEGRLPYDFRSPDAELLICTLSQFKSTNGHGYDEVVAAVNSGVRGISVILEYREGKRNRQVSGTVLEADESGILRIGRDDRSGSVILVSRDGGKLIVEFAENPYE